MSDTSQRDWQSDTTPIRNEAICLEQNIADGITIIYYELFINLLR
jgi:hypothetical protein